MAFDSMHIAVAAGGAAFLFSLPFLFYAFGQGSLHDDSDIYKKVNLPISSHTTVIFLYHELLEQGNTKELGICPRLGVRRKGQCGR